MTLGQRIEQLRRQRDMTLRKLGEKSGISYSLMQSIVKGERVPSKEAVCALARALQTEEPDELVRLAGYGEPARKASEEAVGLPTGEANVRVAEADLQELNGRSEGQTEPQEARCPLCGEPNRCTSKSGACWCMAEEFPEGLLDLVPIHQRTCICKACLDAYKLKV